MPPLRLDDERTIQAIGILADVLDHFSGSTALECTLVSKALRQVQATRSQIGMDFAARAFATLEAQVRQQIADEAAEAAQDFAASTGQLPRMRPPRPDVPATEAAPQATSFLNAVNARGRGPARPRRS
ncbi:hypothetical protein [Arenibaculum pallidiluteum]|uniref:hypothetical protein n=1 Tax=Arenibaculum pallidiluteum TaxID=2812559 RepID=UPI001A95BE2E|nr:hypothetical protein [Arenibaculum pallidiluteum]